MHGLHPNQQKILEYLLKQPEGATLDDLSSFLELSKTATKEHLMKIDSFGLIEHRDQKGHVGRPKRYYLLTSDGHEAFPRQYSWLSSELLKLLSKQLSPRALGKVMEDLALEVYTSMEEKFTKTTNRKDRLTLVNQTMNELGYMSSLRQTDLRRGAVIEATNCVYHTVAQENPELCRFDVQFIKHASGGLNVKLEKCISRGDSVCRFCINNKKNDAA